MAMKHYMHSKLIPLCIILSVLRYSEVFRKLIDQTSLVIIENVLEISTKNIAYSVVLKYLRMLSCNTICKSYFFDEDSMTLKMVKAAQGCES